MKPLNGKKIIHGNEVQVLCNATVDLKSSAQRPYLFKVTVMGVWPHLFTEVYEIYAKSDTEAAMTGIDWFVKKHSRPLSLILAHPQ